jgi:hypothetical protein
MLSFDAAYSIALEDPPAQPDADGEVELMTCKNYTDQLIMIKQKTGANNQTAAILAHKMARDLRIDADDIVVEIGERHLDALVKNGTIRNGRMLSRYERVSQGVVAVKETARSGCVYTGIVCRALCGSVSCPGSKSKKKSKKEKTGLIAARATDARSQTSSLIRAAAAPYREVVDDVHTGPRPPVDCPCVLGAVVPNDARRAPAGSVADEIPAHDVVFVVVP